MYDAPDAQELLGAVAAFLREQAIPALSGATAFQARVAARMLEIAQRELQQGPQAQREELVSLRGLLKVQDGEAEALRRVLCERIAAGALGLQPPGLAEHLWHVTLAKLAVDQPDYDTYQRLRADPAR